MDSRSNEHNDGDTGVTASPPPPAEGDVENPSPSSPSSADDKASTPAPTANTTNNPPPLSPRDTPASPSNTTNSLGFTPPSSPSPRSRRSSSTTPREYPIEFYCPITHQLLKDPVVLADGISYERSAALARLKAESINSNEDDVEAAGAEETPPPIVMYSNRALKTIIEESTRTTLQKFQHTAKQLLLDNGAARPLSGGYYCPITLGLMHVPVIDPQGYSYERVAIENWILVNGDSPVTRNALTKEELIPNTAIVNLLLAEANSKKDEDLIHPAIRKWKHESPPVVPLVLEPATTTTVPDLNNTTAAATASLGAADTNNSNINNTTTASFPLTREEFQIRQEAAERKRRNQMLIRLTMAVIAIAVVVVGFYYPVVAVVALVMIILMICLITQDAARMDDGF